jgi:ABC-type branched-subunit amino acid transport system substrate-binding protein
MRAHRRTRATIATVLTLVVLAAACTSGDDAEEEGSATTAATETTLGELTASARGVTEDTITVAYTYLDFDSLVEQNLVTSGWGDQELAFQTLVDDLNADGGINGRQVEAVFEAYSPVGTEDAEAACLRLTQDTEVFAVLGGFLGPAEPANSCIVGRGDTILVGGVQSDERLAEARAPWITDRAQRARKADILLGLLEDNGDLEGASVALVTNIDAEDIRGDVQAALEDHGVEPVEDLLLDAPIGDIPAEDAAWGPLAERIRGSGADTVLIVGNPSSAVRNLASQGLDVQLWATDEDSMQNLGATVEPADAEGTLTATPPTGDDLWEEEAIAGCREAFADANPDVEVLPPSELQEGDEAWASGLLLACEFLGLFDVVATEAGADLTNVSFADAAARLDDFSFPGSPYASLGDKTDANDSFQLAEFQADIGRNGGLEPLTEITDVTS